MKYTFNNLLLVSILSLFVSTVFFSCEEDSDPAPSNPVEEKDPYPIVEDEAPEPPVITHIDPTEGHPDTLINIEGTNFGNDASIVTIQIDGVSVDPISVEDELIVIAAPEHLPGEATVKVTIGEWTSEAYIFTYKDQVIVADSFSQDAAGWTIVGDAQGGYVVASYSEDGGVADGYIYAKDDVLGGVWYFNAPAEYLGDKSNYYGATMRFSLFQKSAMARQFESTDIIIESGDKRISYQLPHYPEEEWGDYAIVIDEESVWLNGNYNSNDKATKSDIEAVLANITGLRIRGEYETGPDTGGMDNFEIVLLSQ